MEKVLRELDVTWATMEFDHNHHPRTKITLLGASEELIETLEDNQVQLQNMLTSKYIAFFQEQVSSWQKKLSNADQVCSFYYLYNLLLKMDSAKLAVTYCCVLEYLLRYEITANGRHLFEALLLIGDHHLV